MEELIKSEGFWACIGALIGSIVGGLVTYIVSRQASKVELKKMKINYLLDKKHKIEEVLPKIKIVDSNTELMGVYYVFLFNKHLFAQTRERCIVNDFKELSNFLDTHLNQYEERKRRISTFTNSLRKEFTNELNETRESIEQEFKN